MGFVAHDNSVTDSNSVTDGNGATDDSNESIVCEGYGVYPHTLSYKYLIHTIPFYLL